MTPPSSRSSSPWFGVGLRSQHAGEIEADPRRVDWYELLADHYVGAGARRRARLERLRGEVPLALHGVSLSIAGTDTLETPYLAGLRTLARWLEPAFVSDHLCWTSLGGHQSHDLLPVAYTEEVLAHVAARVDAVQELLGRRLFLENASAYVAFRGDAIDEAEFFAALCRRTGCGMLLDVNNLFVNAANLGTDPHAYLATIPVEAVGYVHLAGHAVLADVRIDTHAADVPDPVWDLYAAAVRRFPQAPAIVERDDAIPPFAALVAEAEQARARHAEALAAPVREPVRATAPRARTTRPGWRSVQKAFFERLVDKPAGFEHRDLVGLLDDARPVPAARGMRVYSDAYTASLARALATNFATLARVLRSDDFEALAAAYLRTHPPRGHDFASLGAALAAFLRGFELAAAYGVARAALADVAALEQAQLEVQEAPDDAAPIGASALAAIAPEDWDAARFGFARALRIVRTSYDVLPALEAVARGEDPARPAADDVVYLVHRTERGVRSERIERDEAALLEALAAGHAFGDACRSGASAGEAEQALATRGARALVAACERGIVTAISGLESPALSP